MHGMCVLKQDQEPGQMTTANGQCGPRAMSPQGDAADVDRSTEAEAPFPAGLAGSSSGGGSQGEGNALLARAMGNFLESCLEEMPEVECQWDTTASFSSSQVLGQPLPEYTQPHVRSGRVLGLGVEVPQPIPRIPEILLQQRIRGTLRFVNRCSLRSSQGAHGATACNTTCPICLEDFVAKDDVTILSCKHKLHHSCFTEISMKHYSVHGFSLACPVCREPLRPLRR